MISGDYRQSVLGLGYTTCYDIYLALSIKKVI